MSAADRAVVTLDVLRISMRTQWEDTRTSPFVILLGVVQPAVFLVVALVPRADPTPAEVTRVAFGVLLTSFWTSTVWSAAGILRRERFQGTLGRLVTGVHSALTVVLGKTLAASLLSVTSIAITVTVVLGLLREPVELAGWPWLAVGTLLVLLSGGALGLLVGSLFLLTRYGPALSSALMYPVLLLGGMLIPLDLIPPYLRWLSAVASLRWLQEFFVSAATGRPDLGDLGMAALLTALSAVAGVLLLRRIVELARGKATLDLV